MVCKHGQFSSQPSFFISLQLSAYLNTHISSFSGQLKLLLWKIELSYSHLIPKGRSVYEMQPLFRADSKSFCTSEHFAN